MTTDEAVLAWKTFLESTPPYVPLKIENLVIRDPLYQDVVWRIDLPDVEIFCDADAGSRCFTPKDSYVHLQGKRHYAHLKYTCRNCQGQEKVYSLVFECPKEGGSFEVEVMKVGELPPFGAPISARVRKLLGKEDLELYRKGMRSEAQGLGIGAATYYRRIVDSQWKLLVSEIRKAAEKLGATDLSIFDAALKETQFSKAVEMLRGAIPPKLLILDGENPLTLLYQPLSAQLHDLTDQECMQQAADIRLVLTALLENIADVLKDQEELKGAATRLKRRTT